MDSVFDTYEPHTEYLQAVILRPDNFDRVADEISKWWNNGHYLVSKTIRCGDPYSLTVTSSIKDDDFEPVICHLHQALVRTQGDPLQVMDVHDLRHNWRRVASDPHRT